MKQNSLKPIAVSMGDPAGIGREITLKAWQKLRGSPRAFFVIDDPDQLGAAAAAIKSAEEAAEIFADHLPVLPLKIKNKNNAQNAQNNGHDDGRAALASLDQAIELARSGRAAALVTNPVSKAKLHHLGWAQKGQTEYIAQHCRAQPVMMLATKKMRAALATTHLPLAEVPAAISREAIITAGKILAASLRRDFSIAEPHIAVAALNPHAGEDGAFGSEEANIIAPACAELAAYGLNVSGPYPADSLFNKTQFDAFLCMYHDQALIPIKMQNEPAVNITLGLDIIRTSPDHGTAFDIAGKNIADPSSLIASFEIANQMIAARSQYA